MYRAEDNSNINTRQGIIALPIVLLISGIVLEMTIAASLILFYLMQSSYGTKYAAEALAMAQSGASDAAVRIARDKSYGYASAGTYTMTVDSSHQAQVTVCNEGHKAGTCGTTPAACDITLRNTVDKGKVEVTSLGTVRGKNRCVRSIYAIDPDTGELRLGSSGEIGY